MIFIYFSPGGHTQPVKATHRSEGGLERCVGCRVSQEQRLPHSLLPAGGRLPESLPQKSDLCPLLLFHSPFPCLSTKPGSNKNPGRREQRFRPSVVTPAALSPHRAVAHTKCHSGMTNSRC